MLSVLRDKADALGLPLTNPMLLCQDLLQLDLYGTIRAAVSTFDTYNPVSYTHLTESLGENKVDCYISWTNDETKQIILENIHRSRCV